MQGEPSGPDLRLGPITHSDFERAEKFEEAVRQNDSDKVATHALADMYARKLQYEKVIELLTPLAEDQDLKTRRLSLMLLV
jgi:hypothetical protein